MALRKKTVEGSLFAEGLHRLVEDDAAGFDGAGWIMTGDFAVHGDLADAPGPHMAPIGDAHFVDDVVLGVR